MKVAAIDVGSNSIHLVVMEADGAGGLRVLAREKAMVRLARGLAATGRIAPEAFAAGLQTLARMAELLKSQACDATLVCGTAALRDAANAAAFTAEAAALGLPIRVISGEEEARLIHLAVAHAVPFPEAPALLLDIGGASTELTWVHGSSLLASLSLPWGAQRLCDLLGPADPPTAADRAALQATLDRLLADARHALPPDLPPAALALGTSGTLGALTRACGGGTTLALPALRTLNDALWSLPVAERPAKLGVSARRAEQLHVGGLWAEALLAWSGAGNLQHLPVGLREGLVWEALSHGGAAIPPLAHRREASVRALVRAHAPEAPVPDPVEPLAAQLFAALNPCLELGDWERDLLGLAAAVHGIGRAGSDKGSHKRAAHRVRQADLTGFWPQEVELLAQVVRHHRGRPPDPDRHDAFHQLPPWHRTVVQKLAALLRVAVALGGTTGLARVEIRVAPEAVHLGLAARPGRGRREALEAVAASTLPLARLAGRPILVEGIP